MNRRDASERLDEDARSYLGVERDSRFADPHDGGREALLQRHDGARHDPEARQLHEQPGRVGRDVTHAAGRAGTQRRQRLCRDPASNALAILVAHRPAGAARRARRARRFAQSTIFELRGNW